MPAEAILLIVDDASDKPYPGAYRFETRQGIAKAKNKCIELLMDAGCTDLFLSDDDCFPVRADWYEPYLINSQPHLSFTFTHLKDGRKNGRVKVGDELDYQWFADPCGCMLYVRAEVINKVGGFDTDFLYWGYEHVEFSRRVYNAKLTRRPYMDVKDSERYWFSYDKDQKVTTSAPDKGLYIDSNRKKFQDKINDSHFKNYRDEK